MPMPLTPDAFSKLINQDVQWLKANAPDSLERQHIIQVLHQRANDYAQRATQAAQGGEQ